MLEPQGLSAELDNLFSPPEIMRKCATWRELSDEECYSTWNGGQGALVVTDEKDAKFFLYLADKFGVEAKIAGNIIERQDYLVKLKSKFSDTTIIY